MPTAKFSLIPIGIGDYAHVIDLDRQMGFDTKIFAVGVAIAPIEGAIAQTSRLRHAVDQLNYEIFVRGYEAKFNSRTLMKYGADELGIVKYTIMMLGSKKLEDIND